MISPQQPADGLPMEEYARVMPGEKYWRERIAREILNATGCEDAADVARGKQ